MATFLTANMGELPDQRELQDAMAFAQQGVFTVNPHFSQGLAWQIVDRGWRRLSRIAVAEHVDLYRLRAFDQDRDRDPRENRGRQKATAVGRRFCTSLPGSAGSRHPRELIQIDGSLPEDTGRGGNRLRHGKKW